MDRRWVTQTMGKVQSSNVNNVDRQCKSGYNFFFEGYFAVVVFFLARNKQNNDVAMMLANEKQQQQYKNCINRQKIVKNLGLIFLAVFCLFIMLFFLFIRRAFGKMLPLLKSVRKRQLREKLNGLIF